jgi:hypothetical protein
MKQLLTTLRSSKLVFWEERKGRPNAEIQGLWDLEVAFLTRELGANPTRIDLAGSPTSPPKKRAVHSKDVTDGSRPTKRRDFVGHSRAEFLETGLTQFPDIRNAFGNCPSPSNVGSGQHGHAPKTFIKDKSQLYFWCISFQVFLDWPHQHSDI